MRKSLFFKAILVLGVFTGFLQCKSGEEGGAVDYSSAYLPDMNLLYEPYEQLDSTRAYRSFAQELLEANRDLKSPELYVQAAYIFEEAGDHEQVVRMLHNAVDRGMANPNILDKFKAIPQETSDLRRLHTRLDSLAIAVSNVGHFSLEMRAMSEFWPYFEAALKDSIHARDQLKRFIFEGPRELRDFYAVRYVNIDRMYGQMINGAPNYYAYLKTQFSPDSMNALKAVTAAWMRRFKLIYPKAVFPKVYVVPGILNSGGTATEMGMFVGGDMYGRSASMPTEELTDWQNGAIMNFKDLPGLTLHELMHFQQNYRDTLHTGTVLQGIIEEGVCDFLAELSSEKAVQNNNLDYLQDSLHYTKMIKDLKDDLLGEDTSKWLYNGGAIDDRPHDLGYTFGYLITKSYYENSSNKPKAIYELLNTDNYLKILEGSDFAHLLE